MWKYTVLKLLVFYSQWKLGEGGEKIPNEAVSLESYFLNKPSVASHCRLEFSPWVYELKNRNLTHHFLAYEDFLQGAYCQEATKLFYIPGDFNIPGKCEELNICNQTYCIAYTPVATKFFFELPKLCVRTSYITTLVYNHTLSIPRIDPFARYSEYSMLHFKNDLWPLINDDFPHQFYKGDMFNFAYYPFFDQRMAELDAVNCSEDDSNELRVTINSRLPNECEDVVLCSSRNDRCFFVPKVGSVFSKLHRRKEFPNFDNLMLPAPCLNIDMHYYYSRALPDPYSSNFASPSLLRFNLPGYRYCGPGTDIARMDDIGGPVNQLDELCRIHDIDYMHGLITPDEADLKLLNGIFKLKHPFLPLFVAVFEAKRYFENVFDLTYTSSLYFTKERGTSLMYAMAKTSIYDRMNSHDIEVRQGKRLETDWEKLLYDIWSGYCYAQALPEVVQLGKGDQKPGPAPKKARVDKASTSSQTQEAHQPSQLGGSGPVPDTDDESEYPEIPYYTGCRVVINELSTRIYESPSYIELRRLCKRGTHPSLKLKGYHIMLVRVGDPSMILMSHSLDRYNFRSVKERDPGTRRERSNLYFVLGTANSNPDLVFGDIVDMTTPAQGPRVVPEDPDGTFAVILLHLESKVGSQLMLKGSVNTKQETEFEDPHRYIVKKYLQDIVIFGAPCSNLVCDEFTSLIPKRSIVESMNDMFIPIPYVDQSETAPFYSINRCSNSLLPMQQDEFSEGQQTIAAANLCPSVQTLQAFSLERTTLQSSAQKVIANTHAFFQAYSTSPRILEDDPLSLTCQATSLGKRAVKKVLENVRTGNIKTPGKTRTLPLTKQGQIDKFNGDIIKRIIQGYYKRNEAPFVRDVHRDFESRMTETVRDEDGSEREVPTFKCSEKTFRKILRRLGFKFGKINLRDAVLMKPEIVNWRGKFLNALRKNKNSTNPMPVIYLDETWIDPYARTGKAWVPRKMTNYRERAKYTYARNKVGRGPRVIILNAGGEEGFIEGAMEIYPVKKKDANGDYHDNVNAKVFTQWFKKLIEILDGTNRKYIIVMDNAPYHGTSDIPKSSATKAVMYEWLLDNLPLNERRNFGTISDFLKPELWDRIKTLKSKHNYFVLDSYAEQHGHKILRLPPYNCDLSPIEYCWKDVKHEVKKQNRDQTIDSVMRIATDVMRNYDASLWKKHVAHCEHLAEEYIINDGIYDDFYETNYQRLEIRVDEDDDDEENAEYQPLQVDPDIISSSVHDLDILLDDDDEDELLDV